MVTGKVLNNQRPGQTLPYMSGWVKALESISINLVLHETSELNEYFGRIWSMNRVYCLTCKLAVLCLQVMLPQCLVRSALHVHINLRNVWAPGASLEHCIPESSWNWRSPIAPHPPPQTQNMCVSFLSLRFGLCSTQAIQSRSFRLLAC
jgi:hypothetical protein